MKHWLPNAISFQLVWIAAVGGAARGWWWAGPMAVALFATWQIPASRIRRADVLLCLIAAAIGFALDSLWTVSGLMRFATPAPSPLVAPVWIVALWVGFALTLNHSLAALKSRLVLAAALGVIGGPLAYAIAARAWDAVDLGATPAAALLALALGWGIVTPLLVHVATRLAPLSGDMHR